MLSLNAPRDDTVGHCGESGSMPRAGCGQGIGQVSWSDCGVVMNDDSAGMLAESRRTDAVRCWGSRRTRNASPLGG